MSDLILYTTEDGRSQIKLRAKDQTVWLAQRDMAELFAVSADNISLFFLSLPDADAAVARVAERVRQGGHNVPEAVIRRRFAAGLRNPENAYKSEVDTWAKYDNVGERPTLLEWGENE